MHVCDSGTSSDRVSYRMSEGMERRKRMNNLESAACPRAHNRGKVEGRTRPFRLKRIWLKDEERSCRGAALFAALIAPRRWINVILWLDKCYRKPESLDIPAVSTSFVIKRNLSLYTLWKLKFPLHPTKFWMKRRIVFYFSSYVDQRNSHNICPHKIEIKMIIKQIQKKKNRKLSQAHSYSEYLLSQ